jgi:hypothetical protein
MARGACYDRESAASEVPKKRVIVVRRIEHAFGIPLRANLMGMTFRGSPAGVVSKQASNAETYKPKVQTKNIVDTKMGGLCKTVLKARKFHQCYRKCIFGLEQACPRNFPGPRSHCKLCILP